MNILRVLIIVIVVALIVGCGGGGGRIAGRSATAAFVIDWPSRSGASPETAASIEVALSGKAGLPAPCLVNRPSDTEAASMPCTFANLPVGTLAFTITAYPQANKAGVPVGTASGTVNLVAGNTASAVVSAVLNSTIATFALTANIGTALQTGGTAQLVATAKDAQSRLLLFTPGKLVWSTADQAKAQVDTGGLVLARDAGMVAITAQETQSTKSASMTLTITGPTVIETVTKSVDETGGDVAIPNVADAPAITIPAGMLSGDAKVTVSALASVPTLPANPSAEMVGTPVAVAISGAEVDNTAKLTLTTTVANDPNKMTLLGCEHNGAWTATPVTTAGGVVTADLPMQPAMTRRGGSRQILETIGVIAVISIIMVAIERKYTEPPMEVYPYSFTSSSWGNADDSKWKTSADKRVALMVHGLGKDKTSFNTLASYFAKMKTYDAIYAVDYHTGYGIDALGNKLATIIKDRVTAGKIDIYAHSMGGLVSRSAIECHGAAEKVDVFTSMGTPHFGVTASVLASIGLNYANIFGLTTDNGKYVQELADMFTLSPFLIGLNFPTHTACRYNALIGIDPESPEHYQNDYSWALIPPHDGMVESYSAEFDLSQECATYQKSEISLNHGALLSDKADIYNKTPISIISKWMGVTQPPVTSKTYAKTGAIMVWVPKGSFTMGSPTNVGHEDEHPAHSVVISAGFWMDKYEVTVAQYRAFCAATGHAMPVNPPDTYMNYTNWTDPNIQQYPMVYVSWSDAKAYADWAGLLLPTEAQWEYAARGPQSYNYPWGGIATTNEPYNGWNQNQCANSSNSDSLGIFCWPVGSFPGMSWCKVQDLAGNVSEWCRDWYLSNLYTYSNDTPWTDQVGPTGGTYRVIRGTECGGTESRTRSATRDCASPDMVANTIGFRCISTTP